MNAQSATLTHVSAPSTAARVGMLAYGVFAYAIGLSGLMWLILTCLGIVPQGFGLVETSSPGAAIALNLSLVALFGIQHVIMARPAFKERWTKIISPAAERSTFTLIAGVLMASAMAFWQPLAGSVWSLEAPAAVWTVRAIGALGWGYMLIASFAINHFELFGLSQVWGYFRGQEPRRLPLVARLMYRFDRHPIMTGILLGLWAAPTMDTTRFVLAAFFTTYMILGVLIEERTLVQVHGDAYRAYRRRVAALVPFPGKR